MFFESFCSLQKNWVVVSEPGNTGTSPYCPRVPRFTPYPYVFLRLVPSPSAFAVSSPLPLGVPRPFQLPSRTFWVPDRAIFSIFCPIWQEIAFLVSNLAILAKAKEILTKSMVCGRKKTSNKCSQKEKKKMKFMFLEVF